LTFIGFSGLVACWRYLKEMSDSDVQMIIRSLEGLLERGIITFPQYQAAYHAELAAIRKEAREVESSLSPQREAEKSSGVVKTQQEMTVQKVSSPSLGVVKSDVKRDVVKRAQGESQAPMVVKCEVSSVKKSQSEDVESVVKSGVHGKSQADAVVIKSEVGQVKKTKAKGRSKGVNESDVPEESRSKGQNTVKEMDWKVVKGKRAELSTGAIGRSTDGGKQDWNLPSPLPWKSVPEGENYSRKGAPVPVEKAAIVKQKVPALQEAPVKRVNAVGTAERVQGGVRKAQNVVDAIGGAATGNGAAVGQTWSVVEDGQTWRCETQISAEGHSRMCDAEDFIPLVDAGATKGSNGHVLVVGTSNGGHVHVVGMLCNGVQGGVDHLELGPLCDSLPEGCSRFLDVIIQQLTKVGVVTCRRGRKMQVLEVRVVWCLEDELAKTQIDAVNIEVINTESARPSVEGEVRCVSYSVLGIYFGRRR